ncbi:hypothetical protein [Nocardia nepalensis]|uniref:hypothetical protein n=1 Tax=Nocardia nepalensis TaxID=3375448 RepID=UPI003B66E965
MPAIMVTRRPSRPRDLARVRTDRGALLSRRRRHNNPEIGNAAEEGRDLSSVSGILADAAYRLLAA